MKSARMLFIFVLAISTLSVRGYAQTPAGELSQMVEQLQKTPTDDALREKIIKLFVAMKPAPAIPEEARRALVRGNAAMPAAKSPGDAARPIELYEEALSIAPWWGDAYFNLSKARELRQEYDLAIRALRFFLLSAPAEADARQAQDQIYVLEEKRDQLAKAKVETDKLARVEDEKRRAEQARRDVIITIKNIVNNRSYDNKILSYSGKSADVFAGVSKNELFGGGTYYMFQAGCPSTWKFFDDHVELWGPYGEHCDKGSYLRIVGESWGSEISDMRWFDNVAKGADRETSKYNPQPPQFTRTWGSFDVSRGYLFIDQTASIPLKDSEVDPNRRYVVYLYKPF